jgi:hypothetical protein
MPRDGTKIRTKSIDARRLDRAAAGLSLSFVAFFAAGCMGLHLTPIESMQQRPSNVAVYFRVQTSSGDPVGELTAESFHVYEDGQLISQSESQQTILPPEVSAVHYTLLLVDMSGKAGASGDSEVIPQAVSAFTVRVERHQKVAVYAFDGSESLYPIVSFADARGSSRAAVQKLAAFKPRDPSTNLNGAIVHALDELALALAKTSQPMKFGTLVVFADGTDRASRVSSAEMSKRLHGAAFDVFAVGVAGEMQPSDLREIGKDGTVLAPDKDSLVKAFDDVGTNVEARAKSYYLFSYCSPARAGKHEVRIEAVFEDKEAKGDDKSGSLTSEFDATGFAPGCDPRAPPSFDVTSDAVRRGALAPSSDGDETRAIKPAVRPLSRPPSTPRPVSPSAESLPPPPPPPAEGPQDFTP